MPRGWVHFWMVFICQFVHCTSWKQLFFFSLVFLNFQFPGVEFRDVLGCLYRHTMRTMLPWWRSCLWNINSENVVEKGWKTCPSGMLAALWHGEFVDWNHKIEISSAALWDHREKRLGFVGNAHPMTRFISLQVVFPPVEFWLGFWTQTGKSGGGGGRGGNVAGSFSWALNSGAKVNCNEKKVISFLGKIQIKIQNSMSNVEQLFSNGRN